MFSLIDLPYKSLAPVISDETLAFHHGKHLQTYVDNLNKLIAGTEFEGKALEDIIVISSGAKGGVEKSPAIFNNAGQILNHELYFTQFKTPDLEMPDQVGHDGASLPAPTGNLLKQVEKQWGSLEAFQSAFEAKGAGLFGSGWVWLAAKEDGELVILQCQGADNPLCHFEQSPKGGVEKSLRPILTFDVWEHAYYLDYQNRRAAHLKALWGIVDWNVVGKRYDK
ncbi:MAG: superoxide dismutase [Bacteroidales bacterium]|nr:superoxide dismutase [Bacteroidales bacterium]